MEEKSRRGGRRPGAGRPAGSSRFREPTEPMRIPVGIRPQVMELLAHYGRTRAASGQENDLFIFRPSSAMPLPLYSSRVSAGFPSPAEDHMEGLLDLNELLIQHPAATFFVRVAGDSMTGAGIQSGDILVVDRSIEPRDGRIVVAALSGELTVKRLRTRDGRPVLAAESPHYPPIIVTEDSDCLIWGVVTSVIHQL